jgi:hypothetical protein
MTIYNWEPVVNRRGPVSSTNNGVRISTRNESKKAKPRSSIVIGASVMEKLRWVCGDRVDFAIDRSRMLVRITRTPGGGYVLSGRNKSHIGKSRTCDVGFTTGNLPILSKCIDASYYEEAGSLIVEWKEVK